MSLKYNVEKDRHPMRAMGRGDRGSQGGNCKQHIRERAQPRTEERKAKQNYKIPRIIYRISKDRYI